MIHFKEGWYVLYVKSRHEKKLQQYIEECGTGVYLPLIKRTKKWSDRSKIVYEPLIRSYIFVFLKSSEEMYKVLAIEGACFFIKFGNNFAIAKNSEIENLKLLLASEDITEFEIQGQSPIIGEICKIINGPLSGMKCEIIKIDSTRKVKVRIESIRQDIVATIPQTYLSQVV